MTSAGPAPTPGAEPPIIGRARELRALRERLAAALAGRGGLVLIGGEAGVGKTTLAEWLCAEATNRGALVLVGRCYDLSETPPYGPWVDLFGGYAPRDSQAAPPAAFAARGTLGEVLSQGALVAEVQSFLAILGSRQPVVLLLEDLHWADPASLDLLRAVSRGLTRQAVILLATYRAGEVPRHHPLYPLLPILVREGHATRLEVQRLSETDVGALVRARYALPAGDEARLVAYLHARSEGNAFFLRELHFALEDRGLLRFGDDSWHLGDLREAPLPPLLRQVIEGRLLRLGENTRDLLAIAAILGQEIALDLWARVSGAGDEALLEAIERAGEAHLLEEAPGGAHLRFVHALIREALYAGIPLLRRRQWHRRAGEALLDLPAPDPDAVAYHFRQAGDVRAAEWLVRAGVRAQRAYASPAVAERFAAALALLPDDGTLTRERDWLRYRIVQERWFYEPQWALAELDALASSGAGADPYLVAYAEVCRGIIRSSLGDYRRGLAQTTAGVDRFAALPPVGRIVLPALGGFVTAPLIYDEANPTGTLVLHLAYAGRLDEARARGEANLAGTPAPDEATALQRSAYGDTHNGLGQVYAYLGRPEEARRAFALAREAYRALGDQQQIVNVCANELNLVLVPYLADRTAERRHLLAETQQAADVLTQTVGSRPDSDLLRLWVLLQEGRWDEVRALAALSSPWSGPLTLVPALLAREQGAPDGAWHVIRERVPEGPDAVPGDGQLQLTLVAQQLAAVLALDAGDLPAARAWLESNDRWLAWSGSVLYRAEGQLGWAAYYRAAGDLAQARQAAEHALARAGEPRQPLALLAARRTLGELDTAGGRYADATAHLEAALALAAACAAPYERALTLLALADLRAATGERERAVTALAEARALLAPLGANPALARAAALDARLATPAPAALPFGLTAREADVLRLVAQGLPDAQIAERLFVSRHTVNTHLKAIYGKLGVTSRAAATRLALEHDLG